MKQQVTMKSNAIAPKSNVTVVRTITTIRSEKEIPDHLKTTLLKIKKEEVDKPTKAKYTPPVQKAEEAQGAKEPEYDFNKVFLEYQRKNLEDYQRWEIEQPSTWYKQIEVLEKQRSRITRKGRLSAEEAEELDQIDEDIEFCERVLADMEEEYFDDSE